MMAVDAMCDESDGPERQSRRRRPLRFRARLAAAAFSSWYGDKLRRRLYAHIGLRFQLYGLNMQDVKAAAMCAGQPLNIGGWTNAVRIVAIDLPTASDGEFCQALIDAANSVLQPFRKWCHTRKASSTARVRLTQPEDLHITLFALGTESEPRPLPGVSDRVVSAVSPSRSQLDTSVFDLEAEADTTGESALNAPEEMPLSVAEPTPDEARAIQNEINEIERILKPFEVANPSWCWLMRMITCGWASRDVEHDRYNALSDVPLVSGADDSFESTSPMLELDRLLITETGVILAVWRVAYPWAVNVDCIRYTLRRSIKGCPSGQTELILHTTLARVLLRRTRIPVLVRREMDEAAHAVSQRLSGIRIRLDGLVHITLARRMSGQGVRRNIRVHLGSITYSQWIRQTISAAWNTCAAAVPSIASMAHSPRFTNLNSSIHISSWKLCSAIAGVGMLGWILVRMRSRVSA